MNQLPFSVYDFFGYLAAGAVVLAAFVASFFGVEPFEASPALIVGFLLVIAVYVLGHLVANIVGDLIERRIVRKRLGTPTDILFGRDAPNKRRRSQCGGRHQSGSMGNVPSAGRMPIKADTIDPFSSLPRPTTVNAYASRMPASWIEKMDPQIIVIGEAPKEHLEYYEGRARVDPHSFIADSDPQFEEILAADPTDLHLEVRGDPELFEPPGRGSEIAADPAHPAGVHS